MTLRLSVAMCTYNGERFLEGQLQSLEQQSRPPDEVVVFDDCSKDSSANIVESFAKRASFDVQLHVNPGNVGTSKNFENAIRTCTGEIIALADQDDFWFPEKLGRIEQEFLSRPDVGCLFTDAEVTDQDLASLGYNLWSITGVNRRNYAQFVQGDGLAVLLRRNVATGATMAFRSVLKRFLLPIPSGWVHDEWIAIVSASVSTVSALKEVLIKYRQHDGNQIGAKRNRLAVTVKQSLSRDLLSAVAKSKELRARLEICDGAHRTGEIRSRLEDKIAHIETRMKLREGLRDGLGGGVQELLRGRYGKYSNGLRSFMSDCFC